MAPWPAGSRRWRSAAETAMGILDSIFGRPRRGFPSYHRLDLLDAFTFFLTAARRTEQRLLEPGWESRCPTLRVGDPVGGESPRTTEALRHETQTPEAHIGQRMRTWVLFRPPNLRIRTPM